MKSTFCVPVITKLRKYLAFKKQFLNRYEYSGNPLLNFPNDIEMQFGGYEGIVDLESILKGYFILRAY